MDPSVLLKNNNKTQPSTSKHLLFFKNMTYWGGKLLVFYSYLIDLEFIPDGFFMEFEK